MLGKVPLSLATTTLSRFLLAVEGHCLGSTCTWSHGYILFDQKFITLSNDFGHQEQLLGIFFWDKFEAEHCLIVLKCLKTEKDPYFLLKNR